MQDLFLYRIEKRNGPSIGLYCNIVFVGADSGFGLTHRMLWRVGKLEYNHNLLSALAYRCPLIALSVRPLRPEN
jgi:hypothetical protein